MKPIELTRLQVVILGLLEVIDGASKIVTLGRDYTALGFWWVMKCSDFNNDH